LLLGLVASYLGSQVEAGIDWLEDKIDKYANDVLDGLQSLLSVAAILAPPGVAQLLAAADLLISYARGHEIRKRKEEKKRGQKRKGVRLGYCRLVWHSLV